MQIPGQIPGQGRPVGPPGTKNWGNRPWRVDFSAIARDLPEVIDYAVVGGGFAGLAAASWLTRVAPGQSVALLEAGRIGAGSSGHTGGVALAESAAGDLPGLGDVLAGYQKILGALEVEAELSLSGVYELGRSHPLPDSPIRWTDSGDLCAVKEVPGGSINPGKVLSGLARFAERSGVLLLEDCPVESVAFPSQVELHTPRGTLRARHALFATNAFSSELTGLRGRVEPAFTLALATAELGASVLEKIGLGERKPFYTVDLPYLWGRLLGDAVIFGSGLVFPGNWQALHSIDIARGEAATLFRQLESRVRNLHPALHDVAFTHHWGGPIAITSQWKPVFERHPDCPDAIVLGGFSGHGVAQSVYLGAWAAEVLAGKRDLPSW